MHLVLGACHGAEPSLYHFPKRLMPDLATVLKATPSLRAIQSSITDHRWPEEISIALAGILGSNPTLKQFAQSGSGFWIYHDGFAALLEGSAKANIELNLDGGCEGGYCSQSWPANFREWADIFSSDDPFTERTSVNAWAGVEELEPEQAICGSTGLTSHII